MSVQAETAAQPRRPYEPPRVRKLEGEERQRMLDVLSEAASPAASRVQQPARKLEGGVWDVSAGVDPLEPHPLEGYEDPTEIVGD